LSETREGVPESGGGDGADEGEVVEANPEVGIDCADNEGLRAK
jgi:hypothetical protein